MKQIITAAIHDAGTGKCSLTGKADADGLTVAFDGEEPTFISWKAFRQLLSYRLSQGKKDMKPGAKAPANGPAVAAPVK
jgi:hypothetical protein